MKLIVSAAQHALTIKVARTRICADNAVKLKDLLLEFAAQGSRVMVIDLGSVRSIDSSGIAAFLIAMKMLGPGGHLALCNLGASVEKAFRITRMDRVFSVFKDVESALADIGETDFRKAA